MASPATLKKSLALLNVRPKRFCVSEHHKICFRKILLSIALSLTIPQRYKEFLEPYKDKHLLLLELGAGFNTPVIIKYPFWEIARKNKQATYVCVNKGDLFAPKDIEE